MRVISLNNDIGIQDGGNTYTHGYSGGAQRTWLDTQLRAARADTATDWIVVCMHQVAISTADQANGADLGIRENWIPLFDTYGVDLVVCGHEHHYERSHPIPGEQATHTRTPIPTPTTTDVLDTSKGPVHMVIGGGGTSAPSNTKLFTPAQARVLTARSARSTPRPPRRPRPTSSKKLHGQPSATLSTPTASPPSKWTHRRRPTTSIHVTYYAVTGPYAELTPIDRFTLSRPRST